MTSEPKPSKPGIFVDADVLFSGAASPNEHGASLVLLRMAELTLIEAITSQQVVAEVERNLADKFPESRNLFRLLLQRSLRVVPSPSPVEISAHDGKAHPKDLPILVAALREKCPWLVTFNVRHYQPGHPDVIVQRPGDFVNRVRSLLVHLAH